MTVATAVAFLGIPTMGSAKSAGRTALCQGNLRALTVAWTMYSEASGGTFVQNAVDQPVQTSRSWALGWLTWSSDSDNTNILNLVGYGRLGPYLKRNPNYFRCPEDTALSSEQRSLGWAYRVRSYSMNNRVGNIYGSTDIGSTYNRHSDLRNTRPDRLALFVEEHPNSINDASFSVDPNYPRWVDFPGNNHEYSGAFSFVDGHTELKRWQSVSTRMPLAGIYYPPRISSTDLDWRWIRERFGGEPHELSTPPVE